MIESPKALGKRLTERRTADRMQAEKRAVEEASDVVLRFSSVVSYDSELKEYFQSLSNAWHALEKGDNSYPDRVADPVEPGRRISHKMLNRGGRIAITILGFTVSGDQQRADGQAWGNKDVTNLHTQMGKELKNLRADLGIGSGVLSLALNQPVVVGPNASNETIFRKYSLLAPVDDLTADYLAQSRNVALDVFRRHVPGAERGLQSRHGDMFVPGIPIATLRGAIEPLALQRHTASMAALTANEPLRVMVHPESVYREGLKHVR
jgi:hypothetical protein